MIYTVTLNPAIDYYIELEEFQEQELNHCENSYTIMGGKGINVSKVLDNFGIKTLALGFVGGFTGDYIKKDFCLAKMKEQFTELKENTRINIKMKTKVGESEIAGKAPDISEEDLKRFYKTLEQIKEGDLLVLSGSVPKSLSDEIYAEMIARVPKGVRIILDARGKAFAKALEKGVYFTKPNRKELEEYFEREIPSLEELVAAAKELQKRGSKYVIVSRGGEGSFCVTEDKVLIGNAPKGKLISSVGAGDSMVGGILYALEKGCGIEEAYSYGIAAGSATAFSEGLTNLQDMEKIKEKVIIEEYQGK
ncbi:1-phosphofructokinase [Fusobacterium necrophorum]|uniref:1-phosphofructokinase n=1 Tax=Fusobacterium necrophorum TaxID=859 RepID=A0A4V1QX97_9FUSO|nr:1-phosphofructokinase [Fusobacterium necrophorum]RXZ68896.1 1-phosphofructokinase [Fusobacterium necrophorum]